MTDRPVFGDFLDAGRGHLGSPGVLRRAASRGGDVREISHSLLRVVIVMGRYVQDVSAGPGQAPSRGTPVTAAWGRAGLEARSALANAAMLLHGDIPAKRHPAQPARSELARRLESSPVRVGRVYALERIGHDSAKDRTTIIYVLGAFIRERSKVIREREDDPPEDVKAGIRAVGRLLPLSEARLNLRDADLRNTDLSDLPDDQVLREGANIEGAKLPRGASS